MQNRLFKYIILAFIFTLNVFNASAQWCGTKDVAMSGPRAKTGSTTSAGSDNKIHKIDRCLNKQFSISVHIILDSLGAANITPAFIAGAIGGVNNYFSPVCLSFTPCYYDYIRNFNWDIFYNDVYEEKMTNEFFTPNTINIYYVSDLNVKGLGKVAGYAHFPGGTPVILMKKTSGADVLAHEMGHFFGLQHTFANLGTELVTRGTGGNCDTAGDGFCDTEADPEASPQGVDANCQYLGNKKDPNGDFYVPPVDNIMSYYSHSGCAGQVFTIDQFNWIIYNALTSNRSTLW